MILSAKCEACVSDLGWPDDGRYPAVSRCENCPPMSCGQCGEADTLDDPCSCWVLTEGMALADLKALFAASDMSLDRVVKRNNQDPATRS